MSSYIVSKNDIALLTEALFRYEVITTETTPDAIGALLWDENHRSVNERYNEDTPTPGYRHGGMSLTQVRNPLLVYKQVRHYVYQSCDHDAWEHSEAARLMTLLEEATLKATGLSADTIRRTPAWDALPWGLDEHPATPPTLATLATAIATASTHHAARVQRDQLEAESRTKRRPTRTQAPPIGLFAQTQGQLF